jgi:mutual gliding-motility protein MglA
MPPRGKLATAAAHVRLSSNARGSMALINVAAREIHCKIVYYGPGMSGKTSNLQYIHSQVPRDTKGELLSIATETERTLFFDFLPLDLGRVRGFQTRFHLYTVPGQVLYERTRVAVLNGADGVVFVADSQKHKMRENIASLQELAENVKKQNKNFRDFPIVLQYNKRDVPGSLPLETMDQYLNPPQLKMGWQRYEAEATNGRGVFDTLKAISKLVISKL